MQKSESWVNNIELYICYGLFFAMLVVCTMGVVARFVFNSTLPWVDELCRWLLLWISFVGASYCALTGNHLKVDLLSSVILKNRPRAFHICQTISAVIWVVVGLVLTYYGVILVNNTISVSNTMGISVKVAYLSMPIGCGLMTLRVIQTTISSWLPQKNAVPAAQAAETADEEGAKEE